MRREWLPARPIKHLLWSCGYESVREPLERLFDERGDEILSFLEERDLLRKGDRVLEPHSGCGRFASVALDQPLASYVGFHPDGEMVDWCTREITARDDRFRFQAFDGRGAWPWEDGSFDLAVIETELRVMALDDAATCMRELSRVVVPGGRVAFSLFCATGKTYWDGGATYYQIDHARDVLEPLGFELHLPDYVATGKTPNWCFLTRVAR